MSFTSFVFFLFFPSVLILYHLLPKNTRWILLLGASLLFYAWHNVWLLGLIISTILTTYLCARLLEEAGTNKKRNLSVTVILCFGILLIFKYLDFAAGSIVSLCSLFGWEIPFHGFNILLPMGISFYVFQTMSYVLDVYRGTVKAEHHLGYYALFVTFFPQLVAGPIERPGDLIPQLKNPAPITKTDWMEGLTCLLRGYGKKLLIADFLAVFVDHAYDSISTSPGSALALATVFFAFQIYCDFSGYSDIAQGLARLMGIRLQDNFRTPYEARSIRDFWRRWHRSLTTWFTDYLYIPLGGSRRGTWRTCCNTLLTFLVSGLWHGANWTYVAWGALHGSYLVAERLLLKKKEPGKFITFFLICIAWVFFRSPTVADALTVFSRIITDFKLDQLFSGLGISTLELVTALLVITLLPFLERLDPPHKSKQPHLTALIWFFAFISIVLCRFMVLTQHGETAFIYFQF